MLPEEQILDIVHGHEARNAELKRDLAAKSVPLDEARPVDHHFWAPTQRDAAYLARELYSAGFLVTCLSPPQPNSAERDWNVEIAARQSPEDAASLRTADWFTRLAAQFDSVYDGWGTTVG
jgi:hypothetical protein